MNFWYIIIIFIISAILNDFILKWEIKKNIELFVSLHEKQVVKEINNYLFKEDLKEIKDNEKK